jgi:ribosomal protein S18 acetylase RimI-like enzyme
MTYRPTARDFNALFRGKIYGNHDIFTARSYADLVRRHDIDLSRAISTFEDGTLVGTIVFAQRGERAWLSLMGVRPELRRQGHGKRLFGAAVDAVRAAGARSIEFEVVQKNVHAIAMYRSFGFPIVDELLVWARKPVPSASDDLTFRTYREDAILRVARSPSTCWQREPRGVARARKLALVQCKGAYAFVRLRDDNAVLLDAGAEDERAARALVAELDRRVPYDITLVNEPAGSALSLAFAAAGWRIANRQHRMLALA